MLSERIKKHKELLLYGLAMALLLLLLQWLEVRFLFMNSGFEMYAFCIAIIFTILGIWLAKKLSSPKVETIIIEKTASEKAFILNEEEIALRKISKRELDVLQLMSEGLSNQEIAEKLYVSLSTIKTHSSNLFEKLEAKRRIQAVEIAKKLQILQ